MFIQAKYYRKSFILIPVPFFLHEERPFVSCDVLKTTAAGDILTLFIARNMDMSRMLDLLLPGIVVLASFTLEGITGFGCTVIALPFAAPLLGVKTAVPYLCILSTVLSLYIVLRSFRSIVWREYLFILLCVSAGIPIGMACFYFFAPEVLSMILAVVMLSVGGRELLNLKNRLISGSRVSKNPLMCLLLFLGGIVQGALGTGGPFVVIYSAKALPEKANLRATLSILWLTVNLIRIGDWTLQGVVWTPDMCFLLLAALPFVFAGVLLGDYLHHKVNDFYFKVSVYAVLCAGGMLMFVSNVFKLID